MRTRSEVDGVEKLSSCVLIRFNPDAHEAGEDPVSERRRVKCTEKAVGLAEAYQAMGIGLNPEKRLLIPYERDYHGERELEYEGERWKVIRVAGNEYNGAMLTIGRKAGNAGDAAEEESAGEEAGG